MIESIGNTRIGFDKLARRVASAVERCGTVAVFVHADRGDAYTCTPSEPDYDYYTQRHAAHLVGVYAATGLTCYQLAQWVESDIKAHRSEAA